MLDQKDKNLINEIEVLLLQIPSIISCKVVADEKDQIVEIHVLSSTRRSPKQIVRDIQSSVMAKWKVEIDRKIISIAQIEDDLEQGPSARLSISGIEYAVEGIYAHATVILNHEDKKYTGKENGLHTNNGALILIANASLRAIEEYLGIGYCLSIDDVEKIVLAKKKSMIVAVTLISTYEERYFIGSSYIDTDENKSVVRATLDALNRLVNK